MLMWYMCVSWCRELVRVNSCQGSYTTSIQLVTEGIRLGKCDGKCMNYFFVNSIIPFSVFSIPSNSLSIVPCPCSWRLVVLCLSSNSTVKIPNSLHLVSEHGLPRPWQKHDQALLLLRKPLLHLGLHLIIMLKKFKKYEQFKKCTHELWMNQSTIGNFGTEARWF